MNGDDIQIDKGGFVRVHYRIFELLAQTEFTGGELRCLMFLIRKTYGYNKKEDKISLKQWEEGTKMKKQNVWKILQTLLKRNVIYANASGPKRAMTWGFNKHHEQWNIESVMLWHDRSIPSEHDSLVESVMVEHDSSKTSVMPQHDKSVIPPHEHTKDNKDKQQAAAKKPFQRTVSDFVIAYERIWGLTVSSPYIGEQIKDWEARVTFDGWCYALQESAKTRNAGNWKYFGRILERIEREGYQPKQEVPQKQSSVVSFSVEEIL